MEWRAGQRGATAENLLDQNYLASLLIDEIGGNFNQGNVTYAPDPFFFNNTMVPVIPLEPAAPVQPAAHSAPIVAYRPKLDFPKIKVRAGFVGTNRISIDRGQSSTSQPMSDVRNQTENPVQPSVKAQHKSKSKVKARRHSPIPVISAARAQQQPLIPIQPAVQVQHQTSVPAQPVTARRRPNPIPANLNLENCTKCRIDKKACRGGTETTPCDRCAAMRRIYCTRQEIRNTKCLCCAEKRLACAAGDSQDSDCQNCVERGVECRKG